MTLKIAINFYLSNGFDFDYFQHSRLMTNKINFSSETDDLEKYYKENYFKYVPYTRLGIEKDSDACRKKWEEIDNFYQKISNGDFTEKYIHVKRYILTKTLGTNTATFIYR
jgi:hypothetical protein